MKNIEETIKRARELCLPSQRGDGIDPFMAMDVLARANQLEREGRDIIHMEVGQPGVKAPRPVLQAAQRAMETQQLGYTEALGLDALKDRIAQHYDETYGVEVPSSRIVITTGSSAGFILSFLACLDVGDRVGLPSPGYPSYRQILRALGNEPVLIETGEANRWMPTEIDLQEVADRQPLAALLLASPANPTGTMVSSKRLGELVRWADTKGIWFISDEIYHGLTYDEPAETALKFSASAIVINSFSKFYAMTGWRVGWMVVPDSLVRIVERLQQNLFISPPALSQFAAIAAFDAGEDLEKVRQTYQQNRDLLRDGLEALGLSKLAPADGAFYIYADVRDVCDDSLALSRAMLEEIGVAVTPGVDFDAQRGTHYLRFSYAGTTDAITEALQRLSQWPALKGLR